MWARYTLALPYSNLRSSTHTCGAFVLTIQWRKTTKTVCLERLSFCEWEQTYKPDWHVRLNVIKQIRTTKPFFLNCIFLFSFKTGVKVAVSSIVPCMVSGNCKAIFISVWSHGLIFWPNHYTTTWSRPWLFCLQTPVKIVASKLCLERQCSFWL